MEAQRIQIKNHLLKGNSITQLQAANKFDCYRLGGRIYELRKEGMPIRTDWETNGRKRWAKYSLQN